VVVGEGEVKVLGREEEKKKKVKQPLRVLSEFLFFFFRLITLVGLTSQMRM
jgi:hypothetical protein